MERIWKCEFCSETNADENEMQTHEEECSFNPANRGCYSCRYHETIYGMVEQCQAGVDSGTMFDLKENDLPCKQWAGK